MTHPLLDIIAITICAMICGADNWVEIEAFGHAKYEWLKTWLEIPYGIPSHNTFGRVFTQLNPEEVKKAFGQWVQALQERLPANGKEQIPVRAIDGKQCRCIGELKIRSIGF